MRFWSGFLVIFAAALSHLQAASVPPAEFPFTFRDGLLWVEVTMPQSAKPLNFLLDSGADASAMNVGTASRLGLRLGRKISVQGVDAKATGRWSEHLAGTLGGVELPDRMLTVNLDRLSRACEVPVDGLIGADFFHGRVVQIDFATQKIRLLEESPVVEKGDSVLPLKVKRSGMRVPVSVDGHSRQWVRLDTGCATPLQWVSKSIRMSEACIMQGATGLTDLAIPQANVSVCVGDCSFNNVRAGVHVQAIFPGEAGLLGNGLLAKFDEVTIDTKSNHLILKPQQTGQ